MSLSAKYEAFLASPSPSALAEDASLHYITTLTSLNTATAIIKHLAVQERMLKKKGNKVLSAIAGANALSLDIETTLEFISGGGAYLPGLDDNFVADRTVTFPMVHMVHFDKDQKISQIRLYWDQGSLLKQIDVIGARARNWPIRDARDQARLIATSFSSVVPSEASAAPSRRSTASQGQGDVSNVSNAMNDPHASLSLFRPRDLNQEETPTRPLAPRVQSAKPPPREYSELFVGEEATSPLSENDNTSPSKQRIPVKVGGGKNYKPSRLFDAEEEPAATPLSVKTNSKKYNHFDFDDSGVAEPISVKTNPKKYNHFDLGEDQEATPKVRDTARPTTKSKHTSQWDFEDFVTPEKTNPKVLGQAVRHFGWSDDEDEGSPVRRPVIHKARPEQEPQFEFVDDGTPEAAKVKHITSKGHAHNNGLGLYQDHITSSATDDHANAHSGDNKRALDDVTVHVKNENRNKDFGAHWEMTDHSPSPQKTTFNGSDSNKANRIPEDRQKVVKGMDAHWGLYEDSPEQSKKENVNTSRGIKTTGNGMGGRKGTGRTWAIGDEGDDYAAAPKGRAARPAESKSFWDF